MEGRHERAVFPYIEGLPYFLTERFYWNVVEHMLGRQAEYIQPYVEEGGETIMLDNYPLDSEVEGILEWMIRPTGTAEWFLVKFPEDGEIQEGFVPIEP